MASKFCPIASMAGPPGHRFSHAIAAKAVEDDQAFHHRLCRTNAEGSPTGKNLREVKFCIQKQPRFHLLCQDCKKKPSRGRSVSIRYTPRCGCDFGVSDRSAMRRSLVVMIIRRRNLESRRDDRAPGQSVCRRLLAPCARREIGRILPGQWGCDKKATAVSVNPRPRGPVL
jgi:hypothetical protein